MGDSCLSVHQYVFLICQWRQVHSDSHATSQLTLHNQSASLLAADGSLPVSNAYHTQPVKCQCAGDKTETVLPAQSLCS